MSRENLSTEKDLTNEEFEQLFPRVDLPMNSFASQINLSDLARLTHKDNPRGRPVSNDLMSRFLDLAEQMRKEGHDTTDIDSSLGHAFAACLAYEDPVLAEAFVELLGKEVKKFRKERLGVEG